jgi:hypothetical protein
MENLHYIGRPYGSDNEDSFGIGCFGVEFYLLRKDFLCQNNDDAKIKHHWRGSQKNNSHFR